MISLGTQVQQAASARDEHSLPPSPAPPSEPHEQQALTPAPAQEVSQQASAAEPSTKRKRAPKRKAGEVFVHTTAVTGADGKALVISKKPRKTRRDKGSTRKPDTVPAPAVD